jgi:hypothetical protein
MRVDIPRRNDGPFTTAYAGALMHAVRQSAATTGDANPMNPCSLRPLLCVAGISDPIPLDSLHSAVGKPESEHVAVNCAARLKNADESTKRVPADKVCILGFRSLGNQGLDLVVQGVVAGSRLRLKLRDEVQMLAHGPSRISEIAAKVTPAMNDPPAGMLG